MTQMATCGVLERTSMAVLHVPHKCFGLVLTHIYAPAVRLRLIRSK